MIRIDKFQEEEEEEYDGMKGRSWLTLVAKNKISYVECSETVNLSTVLCYNENEMKGNIAPKIEEFLGWFTQRKKKQ